MIVRKALRKKKNLLMLINTLNLNQSLKFDSSGIHQISYDFFTLNRALFTGMVDTDVMA